MKTSDLEKITAAAQSVDLALSAVRDLCGASDVMLAEHACDMIDQLAKILNKLNHLSTLTKF